ncbi:TRAP transporter substrate-binding protein [Pseudogracilibacillus sp. SE30717A]|uniref:TRAP transporter substrate-binding protein n=1 Tax=Pseudogracilibacillus sp. SE30717A TaxID=3098293 RepID=UPI00300E29F9
MKKCNFIVLIAILLVGLLAACGGKSTDNGSAQSGDSNNKEAKMIKLAHTQAPSHPVHLSMEKFAELVEEKTGGEVTVEIYPSGQLGDERQYIESLQAGTLDMAKVSVNSLENFEDIYSIFSIPYLFEGIEHGKKFMNSEHVKEIYQSTEDLDVVGITWYDAGARNYYTSDTPIEKPEDMEGLVMRVQSSEILIEAVERLGGSATPIDWNELYTAIQQGVVDGADNGIVAFTENNLGEVAKHFSFTEHVFSPDVLLIKKTFLDDLTQEQQDAVMEAAEESTAFHTETWEKEREEAIKKSEEVGVTIYYPDLEPFAEALKPMKEKFAEENEEIAEYISIIEEMK